MKKILISILIILLIILCYFALIKGIKFLNIKSINNIKAASENLNNNFNQAKELSSKTYPAQVEGLENAIKQLKISKQEYESKKMYNNEQNSIGAIEIKTYKIHYLWTILGNYRKDRGVQSLNLDLVSTQTQDVYDLEFTLIGGYTNITDFLYDIENDEELNFEIQNFRISSQISADTNNSGEAGNTNNSSEAGNTNNSGSNTEATRQSDGITLQAKFTVKNIGITLD